MTVGATGAISFPMSDDKGRGVQGFIVGALVAGTVAAGLMLSRPAAPPPPTPATPPPLMPAPMPPGMPPPGFAPTQDPRQVADSLFNEAMMATEQGDQATLAQVLPGALAAYRGLSQLDDDGRYHVALLELSGGHFAEARATCAGLLAKHPNHLLALGVSLRAAARGGDAAAARDFAQRLVQAYEAEANLPLPEYRDHQRIFPALRQEAQALLGK